MSPFAPQLQITPKPGPSADWDGKIDFWNDPHPWNELDQMTGTHTNFLGPRTAEDVILTNVIGFDIKVWDPGAPIVQVYDTIDDTLTVVAQGDPGYAESLKYRGQAVNNKQYTVVAYGAYVDLNYMCLLGPDDPNLPAPYPDYMPSADAPNPVFHGAGQIRSVLRGTEPYPKDFSNPADWPTVASRRASVYDTWSLHYEYDGVDQDGDGVIDEGADGFDNDALGMPGIVDDPGERETAPPYPVPLRGIQIKIRVFEPDTRNIREVTIIQDFLPK